MPAEPSPLALVRAARRRLAAEGPEWEREAGDFAVVSLPDADGDVLRDLLMAERAGCVVEIGLAYGSSALAILEGLVSSGKSGARHLIIDPFQHLFHDAGRHAVTAADAGHLCTFLRERSQLVLPRLVADRFIADAAFVDGSHHFHNVFVDLAFLREIVRPGGLVILDDCQWPSVATAVRYFEVNLGWRREGPDLAATRIQAFRLPDPPLEPTFDSFQPF